MKIKIIAAALLAVVTTGAPAFAQAVSAAPTAAQLAKYDLNKNGRLDPAELTALQADETKARAAVGAASANAPAAGEDTVQLSPFEVREANNGYYAASTMSGTRLNTKIEDLGSAISVVTKQQMADFAMLDINDIFNYEASTEGTGNFTDFSVDRNGMVADSIQNNPQGANRIRGVGAANLAMNNFATSGRVPIDPIGIDGVEISRGPNSNIFGLGQGSGTVNLLAASASLNRTSTTAEVRLDSVGGYRTSIDFNRPLVKGKLSARASAVYQHDAFNEKPSGATSRRFNFMVRAQPFKTTSVRASYQQYDFYGARASSLTPRDAVSYWKSVGSPTWDPIANAVTVNGVTTVLAGTTNPTTLGLASFPNPVVYVDQGGIQLWQLQRTPTFTAGTTVLSNGTFGTNRLLETIAPPIRTGRPLYSTVPGINNKALFDWSSVNLAGANSLKDHNEMTTVELEQFILNSERHTLAVQGGWNHERAARFNKNIVGQSSATGNSNYLYVDVNSKLLDGRANPFFLRPYIGVGEPVFTSTPYERDTFRGQGAYKLDFTPEKNWMKWLGRHTLVGYAEQRLTKTYAYRFRDVNIADNPFYAPAGVPKGNQSGTVAPLATRPYFHFYVGDNNAQNVDYAPTAFKQGPTTFSWLNPATNQWINDPATIGEAGIQEGSAGGSALQTLLKTHGLVLQSAVWQDRIIFTGGKRHDENNTKFQKPSRLLADGYTYDYAAMNGFVNDTLFRQGPWATRSGDTKTKGVVAKPFRGWSSIDRTATEGGAPGFFAGLIRGLSVHYNKSDSFTPDNPAVTVTLESLTNPTANGKDYGFTLNLWNDKLVLRANRYVTNQVNNRNGQFGTFGQRTLRVDLQNFAGNADAISLQRQARAWISGANPTFSTQQVEDAVFKLMGLTAAQASIFNNNNIGETQDITAKGDEIELNFNPDRFWTFKANLTRTQSLDANVAPHITTWIGQRLPVWESIIDPRTGTKWLDTGYTGDAPAAGAGTPRAFLNGNIVAPIQLAQATQGKSRPEIREWRFNTSASLRLAKYTENQYLKNVTVGGSLRYESKGAIGYYGIPINGDYSIATNFDGNRPIYSKANIYADAFATYSTRLFRDKVRTRFQLNVRNLHEWKPHLLAVGAYPDGSPHTFRIVEPLSVIFTTTFDL